MGERKRQRKKERGREEEVLGVESSDELVQRPDSSEARMDRDEEVAASGLDAWEHRRMRHEGTGIHRIFIHRPRPMLARRRGWLAWLDRGDEVVGPVRKVDLGDPKV